MHLINIYIKKKIILARRILKNIKRLLENKESFLSIMKMMHITNIIIVIAKENRIKITRIKKNTIKEILIIKNLKTLFLTLKEKKILKNKYNIFKKLFKTCFAKFRTTLT